MDADPELPLAESSGTRRGTPRVRYKMDGGKRKGLR